MACAESVPKVGFVPGDNRVAPEALLLPGEPPRDPADRMILATAWSPGAVLVTRDAGLLAYPHVRTLW